MVNGARAALAMRASRGEERDHSFDCERPVLAKDKRREAENIGFFGLPAFRIHPGLDAGLLQELGAFPVLLDRNLGKQKPFVTAVLHQQTMMAYLDLVHIQNMDIGDSTEISYSNCGNSSRVTGRTVDRGVPPEQRSR